MKSFSIGGHRYTDPDVLSLIFRNGTEVDPRAEVLKKARAAVAVMESFGSVPKDPLDRLKLLASICGVSKLQALTFEQCSGESRDAFIFRSLIGQIVVYFNPFRPPARIVFSIAHEIVHTFFPNSTGGSQFRHACAVASREANELERLCDLGASELLMPETDFQAEAKRIGYELGNVPALMARFGSSYEATTFRLASANPHKAAAGLLRYRLRLEEERLIGRAVQTNFFADEAAQAHPIKRYRRHSFHTSVSFPSDHLVRWNKSFADTSIVYAISSDVETLSMIESLPNGKKTLGLLQVTRAPYQRAEAHPVCGDLLFLWVSQ